MISTIYWFVRKEFPHLANMLDVVQSLDEFAFRFYQELDCDVECDNSVRIKEQMND